jgi:hypothetical protein
MIAFTSASVAASLMKLKLDLNSSLNRGLQLNEEAFRLAKLNPHTIAQKCGQAIPSRKIKA